MDGCICLFSFFSHKLPYPGLGRGWAGRRACIFPRRYDLNSGLYYSIHKAFFCSFVP